MISIFKHNLLACLLGKQKKTFIYIDATYLGLKIIAPLFNLFKCNTTRLNFQMRDLRDEYGELERLCIPRKDLFELREKIIVSKEYKSIFNSLWKKNRLLDSVNKGIVDDSITNVTSAGRYVYLIKVVHWHMKSMGVSNSTFYVTNWPWINSYNSIAVKRGIKIATSRNLILDIFNINILKNIYRQFPIIYSMARNFNVRSRKYFQNSEKQNKFNWCYIMCW